MKALKSNQLHFAIMEVILIGGSLGIIAAICYMIYGIAQFTSKLG